MSAAALSLAGYTALEGAALAAVKLSAAMPTCNVALCDERRRSLVASLERLHQAGVTSLWLTDWIAALSDERLWMVEFSAGVPGLLRLLGELMLLDDAVAASAPASRPASPPPPSDEGDALKLELSAARAATGETLPPASGYRELAEMACSGADTEPPLAEAWSDVDPEQTVEC